jgi:hypothetical protein
MKGEPSAWHNTYTGGRNISSFTPGEGNKVHLGSGKHEVCVVWKKMRN